MVPSCETLAFASSYCATRLSIFRLPCGQFKGANLLRLLFKQQPLPCELGLSTFPKGVELTIFHTAPDKSCAFYKRTGFAPAPSV